MSPAGRQSKATTAKLDASLAGQMRSLRQGVDSSERRKQILDDVTALFLREGLRGVTITDLVTSARCSRRTLYEIAPTKEQLFLLVLDRMWRRVGEQARGAALLNPDPAERIVVFLFKSAETWRPPLSMILADVNAYPPARQIFDNYVEDSLSFMADIVAHGVAEGRFRPVDPQIAAELLSAGGTQVMDRTGDDEVDALEALEEAIRLILHGLTAPQRR